MKVCFKVFLLALILAITTGCSKKVTEEERRNVYNEGMEAYATQNFPVALEKFKFLADKGDAPAQFNVGVMYHQGQGVAVDDKAAIAWWTKAAEQGHAEAADNIGLRYGKGQGVALDWVEADKWFSIAAATGNQTAMGNQKAAEAKLTPQQIAQVQVWVKAWQDKHKK